MNHTHVILIQPVCMRSHRDSGRAAPKTDVGREGGLEAGLALLALKRLDHCSLLAANISAYV